MIKPVSSHWRKSRIATQCVHAGVSVDLDTRAVKAPIHMSTNYELPVDSSEFQYIYNRQHNPTVRCLEERLAVLEGGEDAMVGASGVGVIAATLFTLLENTSHIVASNICYVAILQLFTEYLPKQFGIDISLVNTARIDEVKNAIQSDTKIIYVETPANPTTRISDIKRIAEIASEIGALLIVDSTWSGLLTQRPLEMGADLVIHSATKYINGHGDALGGAVIGSRTLIDAIREAGMVHLGPVVSPFNAWLIMRGMSTLPLRMRQHCSSTEKVAAFLESHPKVKTVRYPGLPSHPEHKVAAKQMNGFSGMLNFELNNRDNVPTFLDALQVFTHAVSLGHDESLIMYYPEQYGDEDGGFFRVSIGLEDVDDLIEDLERALGVAE
jgi:methionine-gamma-lyase